MLAGLVTAWRLASWPTRRSPVLVKATTDGTVRPPSADAMTVGSPPSMTATTEFVVPRSMPMILPMVRGCSLVRVGLGCSGWSVRWVVGWSRVAATATRRRAEDAVAQAVAAAELVDDLAVRAGPCPGRWRSPRAREGRTAGRAMRRSSVTPSLSSRARSLRSMAAMPSNQRVVRDRRRPRLDGPVEVVGDGQHLADAGPRRRGRGRAAAPRSCGAGSSGTPRARAGARRGTRRPLACAASRSVVRASISASSSVGEMSISSTRSWARVRRRSGIQVIHQFIHQAGDEADRADRLGVATSASGRGRRRRRSPGPVGRTAPGRARRRACRAAGSRGR